MGKKGQLTFEKRALNIRRGVRPHLTHPPRYASAFPSPFDISCVNSFIKIS